MDKNRQQVLRELKERARKLETRIDIFEHRIKAFSGGSGRIECPAWIASVDPERCVACGMCREVCPVGAIQIKGVAEVNNYFCIGCGVCADTCPKGAISLEQRGVVPVTVSQHKRISM